MAADRAVAKSLARLTARYGLIDAQQRALQELLGILERNEHAPTAVREPRRALDVHLADSLVALELEVVRAANEIADLGAGAGFPGLALAVALPRARVRLIESQARKCAFIEEAIGAAGLHNASVVCARAEECASAQHDLVLARALAPQQVVLEYAAPLLSLGGSLVDWRGARAVAEERAASTAARELGLSRVEVRKVEPFAGAREHHLHVFAKDAPTPARFPRRPGIARKRPLGA
jgi:16S rRNA (guanine527-N7)-methyltransferase